MLEVTGLGVSYGSTRAVDDFSFTVGSGEAVALLGANGAGKTSTLRAVSRLVRGEGRIVFDGDDVTGTRPEELSRMGLVHVPEGRRVFATLTVNDNLLVGQTAGGRRKRFFGLDAIYDLFPALVPLRKRYGWSLSGGEQQMVAIGRALMAAPKLIMLDEPSLGLAPIVVKAVYQALSQIKSELAVLLVEQNAAVALSLCDKGHVLLSGREALSGTAAQLGDREALIDSYLGHGVDSEDAQDGEAIRSH
ncbi:ABC transporter ATP-binding protein [Amycolatopsis sp. GM8]|uniref:ABC transporter ATP-binding protein n=1 Tax=Amycolatopsis sp. GM8 TaxID=2896530 RepID=UPI001F2E29F3|nr:ABC transporter ATP-binding protein [Amycolatopsis sp. GM8]